MKIARVVCALLITTVLSSCAPRPAAPPRSSPLWPNPELERLVDAFKPCVSVLGSSDTLPLARTGPSAVVWYRDIVSLSDGFPAMAIISHPFSHTLLVDPDSGLLYIAQVGGFFDDETLFGPFTADEGCAESALPRERTPAE